MGGVLHLLCRLVIIQAQLWIVCAVEQEQDSLQELWLHQRCTAEFKILQRTLGGEQHLQWNFIMFLMSSISFSQKGIFNNSFPIASESGILPEFWLQVRAAWFSNLISSPDIMDIILCRTDFWKYVLSYLPCTIHPLESPLGQLFHVTAGSESQSNAQGGQGRKRQFLPP